MGAVMTILMYAVICLFVGIVLWCYVIKKSRKRRSVRGKK